MEVIFEVADDARAATCEPTCEGLILAARK